MARSDFTSTSHLPVQPPYVLFFSLFMICAGLTLPRTSGTRYMVTLAPAYVI